MDDFLKEDVINKFKKRSDSSYIVISIGDLRELLPILSEIDKDKCGDKEEEKKECIDNSKTKLISPPDHKKLIPKSDKIIPIPELEKQLLEAALIKTGGDIDETAKELGISKRTVYRMLVPLRTEKYGRKKTQNS